MTTMNQIQQVREMLDRHNHNHFGSREIIAQVCDAVETALADGDSQELGRSWNRLEAELHGLQKSYTNSRDSSLSHNEREYWHQINIAEHALYEATRFLVRGVTREASARAVNQWLPTFDQAMAELRRNRSAA